MTMDEAATNGMDVYGSSAGSSGLLSRSSSVSGMSPEGSDGNLSNVTSESDKEQGAQRFFNPEEYLAAHKKALLERSRRGAPGQRMKGLYRYWATFLVDNFNDAMYRSFLVLSQEDASNGHMFGLQCLVAFFKARLASNFEKDQFVEFEQLAHRFHDYLNFDLGLRALLELLTMGSTAGAVRAAGVVLSPMTDDLLAAWAAHVASAGDADSTNPRAKLHQQLAEKRKKRTKQGRRVGVQQASAADGAEGGGGGGPDDGGNGNGGSAEAGVGTGAGAGASGGKGSRARRAESRRHRRDVANAAAGLPLPPQHSALLRRAASHGQARAQVPWLPSSSMPQARPVASQHPDAQRLPDRLGDVFGD